MSRLLVAVACVATGLAGGVAHSQPAPTPSAPTAPIAPVTPTVPVPGPVETQPLSPPAAPGSAPTTLPAPDPLSPVTPAPIGSTPAPTVGTAPSPSVPSGPPAATIVQPGAPAAPPTAPAIAQRPTLLPQAGDPVDVNEVMLPRKPVALLAGSSSWDDGLKTLQASFRRIEEALGKAGMQPAGRPLAVFTETTDDRFRFEAMIPIDRAPDPAPILGPDMRFGFTPAGKAYRFVHKGAYDDIDQTYETITAYLDAKDIVAQDAFVEEYVNDPAGAADVNLEVNIFVQPK